MITALQRLYIFIAIIFFLACRHQTKTLFTVMPSSATHINFRNDIKEDENNNILTYEYLYNGGGVAVGDVNNDGLTDIMFTANMMPNKLYLNKGNFQFEDITDKAGVAGRSKWKTGVVMADVNGDGLLDIYVCYSGTGTDADRANELYINKGIQNGVPVFTESAKSYGLDAPGTYTTTASFFDMDNDGDLDMFMVNHADMFYNPFFNTEKLRNTRNPKFGNRLYRNDGNVFKDISDSAHIDGSGLNFGLSVATSDINNDGFTDIYVTNDYDERDFLYLNNHDGTFREVLTKAAGHISEFAMGSDIADYNNDSKPDVMVLDMLPEDNHRQKLLKGADTYDKYMMRVNAGFHHQQMRNTLQLNNGIDSSGIPIFSEVGQMADVSNTDWSWAPLFADFDNDGWKDLFISNGIFKDITNLDFVKYTSGYSSSYDNKVAADKSTMWQLIQQMPSTKISNYIFRNNHQLGFTDESKDWGFTEKTVSNGAAYADLDNDGDLDLVINNLNDDALIYRNNTTEEKHAHYLKLKLQGDNKNTLGIGAKVYVQTTQGTQFKEQFITRGFQSSVDPVIHFGLGNDSVIQSVKVIWPGEKTSMLINIKADTLLTIKQSGAAEEAYTAVAASAPLFENITATSGIDFIHKQSAFVDFKISPLLPYQLSKVGPALAKADVNGDGLEDVFIGASAGQESKLFLQTKDGKFVASASNPWNNNKSTTITDGLFFDADKDGDVDLYLVSGGADYFLNNKNYQDRFFENDGKGNFTEEVDALPKETISGSCVRAADINKDGLPDLFVGGKINPGLYPTYPESQVLKNKSVPGHILFEKDNSQTDTTLTHPGMVTDALWIDINKDGWEDLVVVGEFMPVTVFENNNGRLANATAAYGLTDSNGWWCRLLADDFDKDGDTDIVIGNLGNNTPFKVADKEPLQIVYGDFYGNGTVNPVLCYYNMGKSYPYYSRDEMMDQVPSLNKKFLHYSDYADAQITDLFNDKQLSASHTADIKNMQSVLLVNNGNKTFSIKPLPAYAQLSTANSLISKDVDGDGNNDIILAGNFYPMRAQLGPMDAGIGIVLKNNGNANFTPLTYDKTRLLIRGDARNMIELKSKGMDYLIIAKAGDAVQVERMNK